MDFFQFFFGDNSSNVNMIELATRYFINLSAAVVLIRYIYYPKHKNKEFFFTFFLFNAVNFLICYLLSGAQIQMGFAFGLFAIFSILRYRTITVPIREMGYFFACIALALLNALVNFQMGVAFLLAGNVLIVGMIFVLERFTSLSHANFKQINYERIDLIKPETREAMIADLQARTGLPIYRVDIIKIDFLRDTARIKAYYLAEQNESGSESDGGDDD
jgi:Domain of unknown function (DUF4956)